MISNEELISLGFKMISPTEFEARVGYLSVKHGWHLSPNDFYMVVIKREKKDENDPYPDPHPDFIRIHTGNLNSVLSRDSQRYYGMVENVEILKTILSTICIFDRPLKHNYSN